MRLRPHRLTATLALGVLACLAASAAGAQQGPAAARTDTVAHSIAARTAGLERREGFIPLYVDAKHGKLYLEIPRDSLRTLYFLSLAAGLGSNPVGLDRGMDQQNAVALFERSGDKVLVVLENLNYRSSAADNPAHARTVRESFAPSTIASLPIVAEEHGRMLVDATAFVYGDLLDAAGALERAEQGSYAVDRDRSSVYPPYTRAFPENTEIDVALTFVLQRGKPGRILVDMLPDARALTLRQHLSLVRLPDDGYRPRALDPRVGYFGITFKDYAQPIQLPLEQRWIARHRLERVNPGDPNSPIKNPIVYYIDRGIPEPIRTATKAGVSWWIQAFDAAGLKGAFKVEDLPEGVDPMDARYNVVQWENRNERGWSIGGSLMDPRTGEIIKGMARLDSHRARTDYNLYAGLVGADPSPADTHFVLARVRQVSAHEVGHTLGLAHNYIASTYERASVMDYPPPRARLDAQGRIDLSEAYAIGPGAYDVWAIRWGYGIFPAGTERDSLQALIADGLGKGFLFLSDADARPDFAADPRTNLWDDAASASEFLRYQMDVRRVALRQFGERNVRPGDPVALLQERFAPVYFFHRFALNSLVKTIGGMEYANAVRGDGQQATRPIDGARQRAALHQLLGALAPAELAIPDTIITLLGPRPFSYERSDELFGTRTRPMFDELGAARTLAQMIIDPILERDRAARLVQFAATRPGALSLDEVIDSLTARWGQPRAEPGRRAALERVVQRAVADRLLAVAADQEASPDARAIVDYRLVGLERVARRRAARTAAPDVERAHWLAIADDLRRWTERRALPSPTPALKAPPGDPFGDGP